MCSPHIVFQLYFELDRAHRHSKILQSLELMVSRFEIRGGMLALDSARYSKVYMTEHGS